MALHATYHGCTNWTSAGCQCEELSARTVPEELPQLMLSWILTVLSLPDKTLSNPDTLARLKQLRALVDHEIVRIEASAQTRCPECGAQYFSQPHHANCSNVVDRARTARPEDAALMVYGRATQ